MACGCSDSGQISGWEMQNICTLKDAADFVYRKLGAGVLCVQLTPQHVLDCCSQALRMAYRYLYGDAQKREYLIFKLIAGTNKYFATHKDKDGNTVLGNVYTLIKDAEGKPKEAEIDPEEWCRYGAVWDFSIMNFFGGINTLHSAENLLLSDWARNLTNSSSGIVGWNTAMTYLKQVDNEFGARFTAEMHEPSHTLTITPTPKFSCFGLMQIWQKSEVWTLLNNPLVLDLMEAYALMQLGRILNKYSVTLAGGGQLNGSDFYTQGKDLYDMTMERIRGEADPPLFFIG